MSKSDYEMTKNVIKEIECVEPSVVVPNYSEALCIIAKWEDDGSDYYELILNLFALWRDFGSSSLTN